jgi:hypothetical protein
MPAQDTPSTLQPSQPASEAGLRTEPNTFDRQEYLASAGLQMVETRHPPTASASEQELVHLGRPRRAKPAQLPEEPLVQVETRK